MNKRASRSRARFPFRRDLLPEVFDYFDSISILLVGRGPWRSAICPFHDDQHPSLRVCLANGAFRCMSCGASGRDVLEFHMRLRNMKFHEAARDLGAWEVN